MLNRQTSTIDPDGRLVIFINGNDYRSGTSEYRTWGYPYPESITHASVFPNQRETSSYWGDFDDRGMNHLNDHKAIYRDGSFVGAPLSGSLSASFRYSDGYNQGFQWKNENNVWIHRLGGFGFTWHIIGGLANQRQEGAENLRQTPLIRLIFRMVSFKI